MSFFIGKMKQHLNGHKDLTLEKEVLSVNADVVAIPLSMGNAVITPLVKEGDEVKIGQAIAKRDDHFYVHVYSSVSGRVKGIEKRMSANLKPADHIVIENDHKDTKVEAKKLKDNASKEEIINFMKEMGLLGQGGAGFPAYVKYTTDKCETLLVNAVECEPYITADARMVLDKANYLNKAVKLAMVASGCKKAIICIKENNTKVIEVAKEAIKDIENAEVKLLPNAYPMGWERTIVYEVLKKRYDKLPIEVGAIVTNVTTILALAISAETGLPIYEKYVTVSGDAVKAPANVKCRVGTSFKELVEACGGYTKEKIALVAGGPMMGTAVTKEEVSTSSISNAVTVLEYKEIEAIGCLGCGTCIEHCSQGLQPCNIVNAAKAKDNDRLLKLKALDCVECGLCSYVCPSKIEVTELIRRAKKTIKK